MASRDTLEAEAVTLGLASVSTYQNKKVVESAIERVKNGEDAAVVDNELQQEVDATETPENGADQPLNSGLDAEIIEDDAPEDDESDDDAEDDDQPEDEPETPETAKKERKTVKNRNNGHAVKFDETGRPLMRA